MKLCRYERESPATVIYGTGGPPAAARGGE
jgi:hypothetical protein